MSVSIKDVQTWVESGKIILPLKDKLNSTNNQTVYSDDFLTVYYGFSNEPFERAKIDAAIANLKRKAMNLSSNNQLKIVLREFIACSIIAYKPENISEFKRMLSNNGGIPVDKDRLRKAREAEEKARKAEAERVRLEREAKQKAEEAKRQAKPKKIDVDVVKQWHETGLYILSCKEKLDSKINRQYYSHDFTTVYYAIIKSAIDFGQLQESLESLKRRASALSSSDKLKIMLRSFIACCNIVYTSEHVADFRQILISNGWLPTDPEEEARRAQAAAEAAKRKREAEARARKEAEDRARREYERRKRAEEEAIRLEKRRVAEARNKRIRLMVVAFGIGLIILGLTKGIPAYRYHHTEYKVLMADAETYIAQEKYDDAIKALSEARARKSSAKKLNAIDARIVDVQKMKISRIQQLRQEIETILNTFKNTSFKYGRPENDFKTTQEKIDLLKSLLLNSAICAEYQAELDYIRKRKI